MTSHSRALSLAAAVLRRAKRRLDGARNSSMMRATSRGGIAASPSSTPRSLSAKGAGPQRVEEVVVLCGLGEHDDDDLGRNADDVARSLYATSRHVDVEQGHVG